MKAKKILYSLTVLGVSAAFVFSSCKKKDKETENPATPAASTPDTQNGSDSRDVQSENDQAVSEINDAVSKSSVGGKSASGESTAGICGYDIDSVTVKADTLLLKYNGVTCNNRTRTGVIRLTWAPGTKWKNVGATIKVEYLNYKIVRASDQKSIMLNGTQNLTNVSGGNWVNLLLTSNFSLVNTVTGTNLKVTFEDNKTATYNINRKITYTYPGGYPNGILTIKAEGIGSNNGLNYLENYGTSRNGEAFTSQVTTPVVWNATCGGAVLQGAVSVVTQNASLVFTYGVDANGNPQSVGPNACPYGWKLQWTANNVSVSKVFGYY